VSEPPAWLAEIPDGAFDAAVARLQAAAQAGATVVLAAHVQPDGDALGSALALHRGLTHLGARTVPTVGDRPLRVPATLSVLPAIDEVVPASAVPPPDAVDLLVTLDVASPERLGSVRGHLDAGVPTIVVDHHASATPFGDVPLVAPAAAATAQVVAELLDRLEVPLTQEIATCLYVGLVTDTGRFSYSSTTRDAFELAGRLLDAGVEHAPLNQRLYESRSLGELRLLGRAIERLTFVPDLALVHTYLTPDDLVTSGAGGEATESLIDVVRTADVAELAAICKPAPDGSWRVSLRSRGRTDVGAVAERRGGGGHVAAAGYTTSGPIEVVLADLVAALREA
jgi:bifunctional oligoribonuclease and PAP phosphatase NrnA